MSTIFIWFIHDTRIIRIYKTISMDTTTLSFEELQDIESRIADPARISWEELRLYSRIRQKIQSHEIETHYV